MSDRCLIVLPARLASSRLPEKLLKKAGGKTILRHTYEAAARSRVSGGVIVAVDDEKVAKEVESFGGQWMMTSPRCASGTDRIAEVAHAVENADIFINVQADEPEIDPSVIDLVANTLINDPMADIATAGTPIRDLDALHDPACVKIVLANSRASEEDPMNVGQGRAIYFSRSAVPHVRDGLDSQRLHAEPPLFWHHIGLYAYRRDFLRWFADSPPSALETSEKLEQLRAIEAGKRVVVARVESAPGGIDVQADFDRFVARLGD